MAFLDPPKDTAARAIAALQKHGVAVKVLTGDNELVSRKICHEVGLAHRPHAAGQQVEKMTDAELAEAAEKATLFARLSPAHKQRVIRALQSKGHVVGFLGDGINDAPALRAADVGISVDTAVDIAKEAADIILLEKSLMVLEEGVLEGRKVFANILKYIRMGASSNFGNMFSVLGASAFLPFLPMAADPGPDQQSALRLLAGAHSQPTTWIPSRSPSRGPGTWARSRDSSSSSARSARSSTTRLLHHAVRLQLLGPDREHRCSRPAGSSSRC